jgi:hypothetical protein
MADIRRTVGLLGANGHVDADPLPSIECQFPTV